MSTGAGTNDVEGRSRQPGSSPFRTSLHVHESKVSKSVGKVCVSQEVELSLFVCEYFCCSSKKTVYTMKCKLCHFHDLPYELNALASAFRTGIVQYKDEWQQSCDHSQFNLSSVE